MNTKYQKYKSTLLVNYTLSLSQKDSEYILFIQLIALCLKLLSHDFFVLSYYCCFCHSCYHSTHTFITNSFVLQRLGDLHFQPSYSHICKNLAGFSCCIWNNEVPILYSNVCQILFLKFYIFNCNPVTLKAYQWLPVLPFSTGRFCKPA